MADDITPFLSTPQGYATPAQLQMARDYAVQLQKHSQEPIKHWTQGLQHMGEALVAGLMRNQAIGQENERQAAVGHILHQINPEMNPGGAPGGVAEAAPATPGEGGVTLGSNDTVAGSPLDNFMASIAKNETGGEKSPYTSVTSTGTGHKVYGKYQVYDENIPTWTKAALGHALTPDQFLADANAQEMTAKRKMGEYVDKYGYGGAARAWLAGEGGMNNPNAHDRFGSTPQGYAAKALARMGPQPNAAAYAPPGPEVSDPAQKAIALALQGPADGVAAPSVHDVPQAPQGATQSPTEAPPAPQPPAQQYAQALQGHAPGGGANPYAGYASTIEHLAAIGAISPAVAVQQMMQLRQQMIPQFTADEQGRIIRTAPGQPPQIVGQNPNFAKPEYGQDEYGRETIKRPGQPIRFTGRQIGPGQPMKDIPGAYTQIGPDGKPHIVTAADEAAKPGAAPAAGAPAPGAGGTPAPGIPHSAAEAITYPGRMKAYEKGQEKTAETQAVDNEKRRDSYNKMAETAQAQLPQLKILGNLIKTNPAFYSGILHEEAGALSQLGKLTGWGQGEMASAIQLAKKLGSAGALEDVRQLAAQGTGAVRVPEMHMIEKSNYDPGNTPEANAAVVDIRQRALERTIEVADKAQEYARTHGGVIDANFEQELRDYYKDKPLFNDDAIKHYSDLFAHPEAKSEEKTIGDKTYYKKDGKWFMRQ